PAKGGGAWVWRGRSSRALVHEPLSPWERGWGEGREERRVLATTNAETFQLFTCYSSAAPSSGALRHLLPTGEGNSNALRDFPGNEPRGDRRAVVVQHRHQPRRVDAEFVDQQRAQLAIPVLLDHEHRRVCVDEFAYRFGERECAHPQRVDADAFVTQVHDRLGHRRAGGP